jgi:deazaflavin-dependent oxidoreductase (nitroreductase family)
MNPLSAHRWLYEWTGGRIGHRLPGGVRAALLQTTGRKTGRPRTVPLAYFRDGADYVFVASNNGADRPPAWLLNAAARPEVALQVGRVHLPGTARVVPAGDPDHARLWRLANDQNHGRYDRYQARTSREIPVLVVAPG